MENLKFDFVFLGQSILKYQVPLNIFSAINQIYEQNFNRLAPANKQLVGKIENEHSLFYNGQDQSKMKNHNMLPQNVTDYFMTVFKHYLAFNKIDKYKLAMQSIWVNEMIAGEYNPIHIHQGDRYTGLSSVMILKLPQDMGPEYAREDVPINGKLQIIDSANGQFVKSDYTPILKERYFYIFPYDMRHCVYPHTNPNAVRRTLAANMDVNYNPVATRAAK